MKQFKKGDQVRLSACGKMKRGLLRATGPVGTVLRGSRHYHVKVWVQFKGRTWVMPTFLLEHDL